MQRVGGIVSACAGTAGVLASLFTVFMGHLSSNGAMYIATGWRGFDYSCAVVVPAIIAAAISRRTWIPGVLIVAVSVVGLISVANSVPRNADDGGFLIKPCLIVALVGGVVALAGGFIPLAGRTTSAVPPPANPNAND